MRKQPPQLDYYPGRAGQPIALVIPGGGYLALMDRTEGRPLALFLAARGYHVFVLHYRLLPLGRTPMPVTDVVWAVRRIQTFAQRHQLSMAGWSLWGASAGGHLAGGYVTRAQQADLPLPAAVIMLYPVVTMTGPAASWPTRAALLGVRSKPTTRASYSLERQVRPGFPPTFIASSLEDGVVDVANSALLVAAIARTGGTCQWRRYHHGRHGGGYGTRLALPGWADAAVHFWQQQ